MKLPRPTTRLMMLVVVAVAVLLRLALVAISMAGQPNVQTTSHLRRFRDDREPFVYSHATTAGQYWSEYWRRCLGMAWPGGSACGCKAEQEAEMGKATTDVETSHDLDALTLRLNAMDR